MYNLKPKTPHVSINGVEVEVKAIPDKSITLEEYKNTRANSDGFEALYPKLNDEALHYVLQKTLDNCGYTSNITYNGVLQNILVPLLLKRLRERNLA